jgi:aspartate beta-hydroxylase
MGELSGHDKSKYLTGSLAASWDALFFYRHGQRFDDNHRRFPRTSALLESLELCRIDAQAPEVCFSILQPHTRIEPHHGVTNARVVIHIPLRVPPGCYLEVSQVGRHYWCEGQAMVFDDTFEHSAENPSAQVRGVLLMDSWHPALTAVEREAFRAIVEAITRTESAPVP